MKHEFSDILVLIPAYDPDEKMISYVRNLEQEGFERILLVDDGSRQECRWCFEKLEADEQVTILRHSVNCGKGRALKDGFRWALEHMPECVGVVTADCDGQHSPEDTVKTARALIDDPQELILGTRDFKQEQVPSKSRYGNRITTAVFALFYGKWLNDTQTGLRGVGRTHLEEMCRLDGERYEYEIRMLIYAARHRIPFREVTIDTIYINDNETSHFRPFHDSVKIYRVILGNFLKYTLSSLSASLVDMGIFALFQVWLLSGLELKWNVLLSTNVARAVSSLYNFLVNRAIVFRASGSLARMAAGYYALVMVQMGCSAGLVYLLTRLAGGYAVPVKILVDTLLFLISYQIQHRWIFRGDR